jgi:membrane fusion protein (multidrug efflux system)
VTLLLLLPLYCGCSEEPEQQDREESAVVVQVIDARHEKISEVLERVGSIRATEIVEVQPEIAGIVRQVNFKEGDQVEKDRLLVSLDDRKLKRQLAAQDAAIEEARSRADFAALMYKRFDTLLEENAVAEAERDRRKTELEAARAQIDRLRAEKALLKERLRDTQIHAPMDGVVSESMVDKGDFVKAGELLTVLYSLSLEARFSVPEDYAARISQGLAVEVHVGAYPGKSFSGTVTYISPGVNERTRTFLTKAYIEGPNHNLKSGMFAKVNLILETIEDTPVIPAEALVATQKGYVVYVVEDSVARRRSVEIGLRRPGRVQIVKGLNEAETVAVSGQMRLTDGTKVTISEEAKQVSESAGAHENKSSSQNQNSDQETAR